MIYEPSDDSFLLSKYISKYAKHGISFLDMGCGSGIQSETAAQLGCNVTGADITQETVSFCKKKYPSAKYLLSDLFSNIKGKFDLIAFNPPYLPDAKDPDDIKDFTTGGKFGYEIIERFLKDADSHLTENGIILLIFSSLTKKVNEIIAKYLFDKELLEEQSLFFEKLYCYKLTRSKLLKKLNSSGIVKPIYFAKGRRGVTYLATYKNKECIIKAVNQKSEAIDTITREAKWLRVVNKLGIGPKLLLEKPEFVAIEYLEGLEILDYLESKGAKLSVLLDILDQMILLDKNKIAKNEMTRPTKHIIVRKHKPYLIDFERSKYTEQPSNVPQYLQFISSQRMNGKYFHLEREKIISLSKEYKLSRNPERIKKYIKRVAA